MVHPISKIYKATLLLSLFFLFVQSPICAQTESGILQDTKQPNGMHGVDSLCPDPIADFSYTASFFTMFVTNTSIATGQTTYFWDFGDGNTSTLETPVHVYSSVGPYDVCLTVVDSCGTDTHCDVFYGFISIEEEPFLPHLNVYPNPASNEITINHLEVHGSYSISLLDALGKLVLTQNCSGVEQYNLTISNLENGYYFVRVQSGDQSVSKPIVIVE